MQAPRLLTRSVAYLLLACWSTWPAAVQLGSHAPGAARTDLWNSLWSLWFAQHNFALKGFSAETSLISFPKGGLLLVADPIGALLAGPLVPLVGVAVAYTLLVLFQLTFAGLMAHGFAEDVTGDRTAGWIAGVGFATAPILLAGVHNGTSEAFSGGWTALAVWMSWRAARRHRIRDVLLALLCIVIGALASWYSAMIEFVFIGVLLLWPPQRPWRQGLWARVAVLVLGMALVAPLAAGVHWAAIHPDNLVSIKSGRELSGVRRSTGAADILGFFAPFDFRSPDFRVRSRYGEEFFHCHYLGFVLLIGALRRRGAGWLWLGGIACAVLALGPVLVRNGQALIILTDRAIPLPYFLVERLPGFSSLSLLFRLTVGTSLALSILAGIGYAGTRWWWIVPLAILAEGRLLSPLGGLPDTSDVTVAPAIHALSEAPAGAVMNFPVAGGRPYLYEQTVHGKPVTDTLNFPNNLASRRIWDAMLRQQEAAPEDFLAYVSSVAKREGVRYLVIHVDEEARPDMHDMAVRAAESVYTPMAEDDSVRVLQLW